MLRHLGGANRIAVIVWLVCAPAHAQSSRFDEARRAYEDGAIETALVGFEAALHEPNNPTERVHAIQLHIGILSAITGDRAAATRAFARALALQPDTEVPEELGPDQRALFEAARGTVEGPLTISARVEGDASNDAPTRLSIRAVHAPEGMITQFVVRITPAGGGEPWTGAVAFADPAQVEIPPLAWRAAEQISVDAVALDEYGGLLATTQSSIRSHTAEPAGPSLAVITEPELTVASDETWIWALVGAGAAVVVGVVLAVTLALTVGPQEFVVGPPEIRR